MSIIVTITGSNHSSDEYQAANKLRQIIENDIPNDVIGEIVIFASATLMGQEVKDIDLFLVGVLQKYKTQASFYNQNNDFVTEIIDVSSFCTTIEIKSHGIEGIIRKGTDFYVKYGLREHCVTEQSNKQKISAMNFFKRTISISPYITNIIWFTEATQGEIKELLSVEANQMPSNILGNTFSFSELIQLLVWQKKPFNYKGEFKFDSNFGNSTVNDLKRALLLFSKKKEAMGELSRKRIEQISNKELVGNTLFEEDNKISIYRGRAGTGKTIGLIQTAINLVEDKQCRVIILTYNKALVSDIRRLFALAELPDMFEESCVVINTMQSFFFLIINLGIYNGTLSGEVFLNRYDELLDEIMELLQNDKDVSDYLEELCRKDYRLVWDYVLIDEAQDWTEKEKSLILRLFDKGHILVADGGQQFVRNVEVCDWSLIQDRNNIKLKYCLRQKNNIVKFLNQFSQILGRTSHKIISSEKLIGGKVIIISNKEKILEIHKQEMQKLIQAGNIAYDMMYLVPPSMVNHNDDRSFFLYKKQFESDGIFIWDGTDETQRDSYSIENDEIRLLQYDSSRGLEAWTVFCLNFDEFLYIKENQYNPIKNTSALLLESAEEKKNKYIFNWAMIPMTRAIDTLVITLKDEESQVGKVLKELSIICKDYVVWVE